MLRGGLCGAQAPLKHGAWDPAMRVQRADAQAVQIIAPAPAGTTPRAVFHATVLGPSSLQVRGLRGCTQGVARQCTWVGTDEDIGRGHHTHRCAPYPHGVVVEQQECTARDVAIRAAHQLCQCMLTAPCNCSSSLQAAVASHETGLQFRFSFIPTEPGPHHVTLRLEYYDEATTLEGIERPEEVPPCVPSVSVPVPVSEAAAAGLEPGGQVGLGLVLLRIFSPFNPLGLVSILNPATIRFLRLIHPTGGVCV